MNILKNGHIEVISNEIPLFKLCTDNGSGQSDITFDVVSVAWVQAEMKRIEGRTLTILEATITNERQLDALKSVLRQELNSTRKALKKYVGFDYTEH